MKQQSKVISYLSSQLRKYRFYVANRFLLNEPSELRKKKVELPKILTF